MTPEWSGGWCRCPAPGCDAKARGGEETAEQLIRWHIRREHGHEFCTVCGDTGEIPAVPEPIPCPACR